MAHVDLINQDTGEVVATAVLMDKGKIEYRGKSAEQISQILGDQGVVGPNNEDLFEKDGLRFLEALESWLATHGGQYRLRATRVMSD